MHYYCFYDYYHNFWTRNARVRTADDLFREKYFIIIMYIKYTLHNVRRVAVTLDARKVSDDSQHSETTVPYSCCQFSSD